MKNRLFMQRGITMMEIMVTLAIVAIVLAVGIPSLSTWVQNNQVKSTAQSLLTGLQLARGTAVSQNTQAQFTLTGTSAGSADWQVIAASSSVPGSFLASDGATTIQTVPSAEMGANAVVGVNNLTWSTSCCATAIAAGTGMGSSPSVVFDAFGRMVTASSTIQRIDVTSTTDANSSANEAAYRRRVILISPSGTAILCRPSLPSTNPQGCP